MDTDNSPGSQVESTLEARVLETAHRDMDVLTVLATASVIAVDIPTQGSRCSQAIQIVTLEGGLRSFWKRGDMDPPGIAGVRREVAAYELALLLGWDDLMQPTVLRREAVEGGTTAEVAAIELLPSGKDDLPVTEFSNDAIQRAGVFDFLVVHQDRSGHNWRGIPIDEGHLLKLYDHELAFGIAGQTSSTFWTHIGGVVPEELSELISERREVVSKSEELSFLLDEPEFEALVARMGEMG